MYKMKSVKKLILPILFLLLVIFSLNLNSQIDYNYITGAKKGLIDTLAMKNTQTILKEATGLQEKEINPKEYILGPGDVITISLISTNSRQIDLTVSPEGMLHIQSVGVVDVKNISLSEANVLIKEKVKKVYRTDDVFITLKDLRKFKVIVRGSLPKPAIVSASAVERVSEIIERAGGMNFKASARNIVLIRDNSKNIHVDLLKFFLTGDKTANPTVLGGDQIFIPSIDEKDYIQSYGEVLAPKMFEFVNGDSLSTLIKFSQGFTINANLDSVEFSRIYETNVIENKILHLGSWKNKLLLDEPLQNDFPLITGDKVFIHKKSNSDTLQVVAIEGEILYPGHYPIQPKKDRISDLIARAGGFTDIANPEAALFIRQKENFIEDLEMARLWRLTPSDRSKSEQQYFNSRVNERKGLLSVNIRKIMINPSLEENVFLSDMDSLFIPSMKNFVNVQGRVNNPGLVIFKPNFTYHDYIALAGGYGYRADEPSTMIVKAKGEQFLANKMNYIIEPGDNILVPPQPEIDFYEIFTTIMVAITQVVTIVGVVYSLTK
ncbi:MAG: hypothetical protein HW421_1440 [Ignavibacteria bacterium]|nr:hypothetical protein [Ignavibacteria bacterium]